MLALPVVAAFHAAKVKQSWAAEPVPRWLTEFTSGPFRFHADYVITSQSELLAELVKLCQDVSELLKTPPVHSITHIVMFGNPDEYRRYMQHYFPNLPDRRALFLQRRGASMLFAYQHPDTATDLRHEVVHALLNDSKSELPLWLDEGLAEYFEVPAEQRWIGHAHLTSLLKGRPATTQTPVELEQLEALTDVATMTDEHYRAAWSWVHFLLHRNKTSRQIVHCYLDELRATEHVPQLSRTIARALPNWRKEFAEHFEILDRERARAQNHSRNP